MLIEEIVDMLEKKLSKNPKGAKALEKFYDVRSKKKVEALQKAIDIYNKNYEEFHNPNK